MDESNPSKEFPNPDPIITSTPNRNDNEVEDNNSLGSSESPNQEQTDGINLSSSRQETIPKTRERTSTDVSMEEEEQLSNEDNNCDEYLNSEEHLNSEEQILQRHVLLNSFAGQGSRSIFHCKYPSCDFTTVDLESYLKHEESHVEEGAFHCDPCNMRFTTYANMHRHRLLHMGIRPFECQQCSKRFLRKDQLAEHMLKHTKPRPYRCPFCVRSFSFRPHLKTHLTSDHTGVIVDKACRLCDFKASSPNGAKIHFAMCHLKQSPEASDTDGAKSHDMYNISSESRSHMVPAQNGAIDLATVSQNFSFMPAQYAPFPAAVSGNGSDPMAGPSDLSRTAAKVVRLPAPTVRIIPQMSVERTPVREHESGVTHTCVSALAGSTTVVSPLSCQDRSCCRTEVRNTNETFHRDVVCVKPEPPELSVDDSQNSNVQPTSTMDLSTADVVETTCVASEVTIPSCSSGTSRRRKSQKNSSGDDTSSESYQSPSNRTSLDSQNAHHLNTNRNIHSCYRLRHCEEGGSQRCRSYSRHTCSNIFRHNSEKRARVESESCRNVQNENSEWMEHKVFYNRATSTESTAESPRVVRRGIAPPHGHDDPCASDTRNETFFDNKNAIAIQHIESFTLTCPFCEIIFPDQTLYLLHRSLHSEMTPWKCNLCGKTCKDKYDFNSHVISKGHY